MNVRCPSCDTVFRVDPAKVPAGGVRARCTVCSATIPVGALDVEPAAPPPPPPATVPPPPAQEAPAPSPFSAPEPELEQEQEQEVEPTPAHTPAAPVGPRLSAPFIPPRESRAAAPARPSAPVFRPTPGQPVQPAAPPHPAVEEPAPPPVREVAPPQPAPTAPAPAPVSEPPATAAPRKPINPFLAQDPRQKARRLARALVSDMIVYQPEKRQKALAEGNLKEAFEDEIHKSWEEYVEQVGQEMAASNDFWTEALNEILAGGQKIF